jgi:hypothetical protein
LEYEDDSAMLRGRVAVPLTASVTRLSEPGSSCTSVVGRGFRCRSPDPGPEPDPGADAADDEDDDDDELSALDMASPGWSSAPSSS